MILVGLVLHWEHPLYPTIEYRASAQLSTITDFGRRPVSLINHMYKDPKLTFIGGLVIGALLGSIISSIAVFAIMGNFIINNFG